MLYLVKVISSAIETNFQKIKSRVLGDNDIRTPTQAAPFGVDSVPYDGMIAVYGDTNKKGKPVIIGYINRNLLAAKGEIRLYSVDADGELATYAWLKADGTMELGGDVDNLVRFSDLKDGFDQLTQNFNDFVATYNAHVHASSGVPPTGPPVDPSTATIDGAKIEEIKTL
jgi:hypothetical protein